MNEVTQRSRSLNEEVISLGGQLIAISKTFSAEHIRAAYAAGVENFGENYLKEAASKKQELKDLKIVWHFVGRLQKGNLNLALNQFDYIHGLAKLSHAEWLNKRTEKPQKILIQIKHPMDERDYGVNSDELRDFMKNLSSMEKIQACGLIFLPPPSFEGEELDGAFKWARNQFEFIRDEVLTDSNENWKILSMGMSGDYKEALKALATHVRIGRSIFGER